MLTLWTGFKQQRSASDDTKSTQTKKKSVSKYISNGFDITDD